MTERDDSRGYSLQEAANRLGLSVRQTRRYVLDGRLPAVLVPGRRGREYRVNADDVDTLAATRERSAATREGGRTPSTRTIGVLSTTDTSRLVSEAIAGHLEALERAWSRIADLEAENARLRALLPAPGASTETSATAPVSVPVEAPDRPPSSRAAETRRGLRAAWRRWRG